MKLKEFLDNLPRNYIIVGSILRGKKNPKDIDLITTKPLQNNRRIVKLYIPEIRKNVDIWYIKKNELPYGYFWLAYPKIFVTRVRGAFKRKGYLLNQYGLFKNNKKLNLKLKSYKDIFKLLQQLGYNYKYRSPKQEANKLNI
jgi:DNA polymerase/3'-5' exonuclease PolX